MVWYSGSKGVFTIFFAEDLAKQVWPTNLPKLLLFYYGIDSGIDASGIFWRACIDSSIIRKRRLLVGSMLTKMKSGEPGRQGLPAVDVMSHDVENIEARCTASAATTRRLAGREAHSVDATQYNSSSIPRLPRAAGTDILQTLGPVIRRVSSGMLSRSTTRIWRYS
jgi:hypothetical protein